MQIICDKCKTEIHPQPETARDGEIEHTFFRCPECGMVYPIAVTDAALRDDIARYERMKAIIKARPQSKRFLQKTAELKEHNMKRCRELMDKYPLAPLFMEATE